MRILLSKILRLRILYNRSGKFSIAQERAGKGIKEGKKQEKAKNLKKLEKRC